MDLRGPIPLNAFDLINMVGGAAMGRMFQRPADRAVKTFTQFTTNLPLPQILQRVQDVLTEMGETEFRVHEAQTLLKAARAAPRGKILASCQVYQMTPRLFMLEWRKIKVRGKRKQAIFFHFGFMLGEFRLLFTHSCLHLLLLFAFFLSGRRVSVR